jgi:hypothetical protein
MFVQRFNKTINEFFKQINTSYPEMPIFKELQTKLRMALMANQNIAIESFYTHVVSKYRTQILKQDEAFFLSFDLSGTVLEDLMELKKVWQTATPGTKQSIWKYVKVLTILSEKNAKQ